MPKKTKQQRHLYSLTRCKQIISEKIPIQFEKYEIEAMVVSDDDLISIYEEDTSLDEDFLPNEPFIEKILIDHLADVVDLCQDESNIRNISVLMYMSLRFIGSSWETIDGLLGQIGCLNVKSSHKWAEDFLENGIDSFKDFEDGRGGKRKPELYDYIPELELEAKLFVTQECEKKAVSFKVVDLAAYIDKRFYEMTNTIKETEKLIRSISSCNSDLIKWGARNESNGQRPYFEGHEREDVVSHRGRFIRYFLNDCSFYYSISEGNDPVWINPQCKDESRPRILICHDETTYRSGEMSKKCWVFGKRRFYSKGRGRSHMVSDFLVQHPSGPFLSLNKAEWDKAIQKYPELLETNGINYLKYSATASVTIGNGFYFDNEIVIQQFERLFKLLEFKKDFAGHDFEIIVDNARTHTAQEYSLLMFGMKPGTRCPVEQIRWIDENNIERALDCYFDKGVNCGESKGLLQIAKELDINIPTR